MSSCSFGSDFTRATFGWSTTSRVSRHVSSRRPGWSGRDTSTYATVDAVERAEHRERGAHLRRASAVGRPHADLGTVHEAEHDAVGR